MKMGDWWDDNWPLFGIGAVVVLCIGLFVWVDRSETAYEQALLARAHTYSDTLAVQQIMAQRATANAIAFGAGLVAGARVR